MNFCMIFKFSEYDLYILADASLWSIVSQQHVPYAHVQTLLSAPMWGEDSQMLDWGQYLLPPSMFGLYMGMLLWRSVSVLRHTMKPCSTNWMIDRNVVVWTERDRNRKRLKPTAPHDRREQLIFFMPILRMPTLPHHYHHLGNQIITWSPCNHCTFHVSVENQSLHAPSLQTKSRGGDVLLFFFNHENVFKC